MSGQEFDFQDWFKGFIFRRILIGNHINDSHLPLISKKYYNNLKKYHIFDLHKLHERITNEGNFTIDMGDMKLEHHLIIEKNIQLSTIFFRNNAKHIKKTIFFIPGSTYCWEYLISEIIRFSIAYECNVFCCNPRGIGFSTGVISKPDDVVDDMLSSYKYLHRKLQHENGNNIIMYGHSFGGAISTKLALKIKTTKKLLRYDIKTIVIDRSFKSLKSIVTYYTDPIRGVVYVGKGLLFTSLLLILSFYHLLSMVLGKTYPAYLMTCKITERVAVWTKKNIGRKYDKISFFGYSLGEFLISRFFASWLIGKREINVNKNLKTLINDYNIKVRVINHEKDGMIPNECQIHINPLLYDDQVSLNDNEMYQESTISTQEHKDENHIFSIYKAKFTNSSDTTSGEKLIRDLFKED